MAKLTKKKIIELHRKLWNWLARNPNKEKYDWPEWIRYEEILIKSDCWLCEYAERRLGHYNIPDRCAYCPGKLNWGLDKKQIKEWLKRNIARGFCLNENSPYYGWTDDMIDDKQRSRYARQVRDICERKTK